MEDRCSYGDCPGSPKNSCSCDRSLKYCEFHMEKHLEKPGSHSLRPLLMLDDQPTSTLLAKEMKTLSSTMTRVMLTGKEMFEEICKKLCQITGELTERQDKLIEMASNLSQTENLPQESFKDLGDLKLKFRSSEDFKKVVEDHFSNDSASVDFSLFSDDIKSIMEHLEKSNHLLEEVRIQSQQDKESREEIKTRLGNVENSTLQIEQNFQNALNQLDRDTQEREKRFALNDRTGLLEERIQVLEGSVEIQNNAIEAANNKYSITANGIAAHVALSQTQDQSIKEFKQNAENLIELQFDQLNSMLQQKIIEINQTLETNSKTLGENIDKRGEDLRQQNEGKIDTLNQNFNKFCDRIRNEIQGLTQEYQGQFNRFDQDFQQNVRREIDGYEQFKKDEVIRIQRENERKEQEELKRKQDEEEKKKREAEELKRKQEEEARRKKEEDDARIKEENERKEKEEKEKMEKLQAERKNIGILC